MARGRGHVGLAALVLAALQPAPGAVRSGVGELSGGGCFAISAVTLCRKPTSENWSAAQHAQGFDVKDKKCISKLCDKQMGNNWKQCCAVREELLKAGEPKSNFEYEGATEIKMPQSLPTAKPAALRVWSTAGDIGPARGTCERTRRTVTFAGGFRVRFELPESPRGKVKLPCGEDAADPKATVTFTCGEDLRWEPRADGVCEEARHCPESTFRWTPAGRLPSGPQEYVFRLPRQPNKFARTLKVDVDCPQNSKNPGGQAHFSCHADGQWKLEEEHCSQLPGACAATTFTATVGGVSHAYELAETPDGQDVSRGCVFGELRRGQVTFQCRAGSWSLSPEHTCHAFGTGGGVGRGGPQGGQEGGKRCPDTEFTFTLSGHAHKYLLPSAGAGARESLPCENGPFSQGVITFLCQDSGAWLREGHGCQNPVPKGTVCRATRASIRGAAGPGSTVEFLLGDMPAGDYEIPCGAGYEGFVRFACHSDGNWKFIQNSGRCRPAK